MTRLYYNKSLKNYLYLFLIIILTFLKADFLYSQADNYLSFQKNQGYFFIENKGQWNSHVIFLARCENMNVWIMDDGVMYDLHRTEGKRNNNPAEISDPKQDYKVKLNRHVIKMIFPLTNTNEITRTYEGLNISECINNYFIGSDSTKWTTGVKIFSEVYVYNVAQGINMKFYFENLMLRYDIIISPDGDLDKLTLKIEGSEGLKFSEKRELLIKTSLGDIINNKIYAYQIVNNQKIKITCRFLLNDDYFFGFEAHNYDKTKPLIIDPVIYSTFLGGSDMEEGMKIVINNNGEAFVVGSTLSSDFPVTTGAYQTTYGGDPADAFVTKLNSTGTVALFSTYIGGDDMDYGLGIAIDSINNIFVCGRSFSINFPIKSGAYQTSNGGGSDAFVLKINPSGTALLFSTFIGGGVNEFANHIVIDKLGYSYIEGWTNSSNFPVTPGVVQPTKSGGYDAIVCKINPIGTALEYSTHLGGSGDDLGWGIAIDNNGNAYITGNTASNNFPVTSGSLMTTYGGGTGDAFITKLNATATSKVYSTYLGGSQNDVSGGIVVDGNNFAYITGTTYSTNFPTTSGSYQSVLKGPCDGYVTKINATGNSLVYSTYFGGNNNESAIGINLQGGDSAVITGQTTSGNFPVTSNNLQAILNGSSDIFITKFNSTGSSILFSTYFGGSNDDVGFHAVADNNGFYYFTGRTFSSNYPVTTGAMQTTFGGGSYDTYVTKISDGINIVTGQVRSQICAGDTVSVPYTCNISMTSGNYFSAQLSDSTGNFTTYVTIGTLKATTSDKIIAKIPKNTPYGSKYKIRVVSSLPSITGIPCILSLTIYPAPIAGFTINDSIQCLSGNSFVFTNTTINNKGTINYFWNFDDGDTSIQVNPIHSYLSTDTFNIKFSALSSYGCRDSLIGNVYVYPNPKAAFIINDSTQCVKNNSFIFTNGSTISTGPLIYNWDLGDTTTNTSTDVTYTYLRSDNFNVKLVAITAEGCKDSIIKKTYVYPMPVATLSINDTSQCLLGNSFIFTNGSLVASGTLTYLWNMGDNSTSTSTDVTHSYLTSDTFDVKLIATTNYGCKDSITVSVYVYPYPDTPIISTNSPLCEGDSLMINTSFVPGGSFNWTGPSGFISTQQNPVISAVKLSHSGYYSVKVTVAGCISKPSGVWVRVSPSPKFDLRQDTSICPGSTILLRPGIFYSFIWQDNSTNNSFLVTNSGKYWLTVSDTSGCRYSDSIIIIELCPPTFFAPTIFTPNGDGINDLFEIKGDNIFDYHIIIYNRWGEQIFASNDIKICWDGTFKGSKCSDGVYYFMVTYTSFWLNNRDKKTVCRTVTLLK